MCEAFFYLKNLKFTCVEIFEARGSRRDREKVFTYSFFPIHCTSFSVITVALKNIYCLANILNPAHKANIR